VRRLAAIAIVITILVCLPGIASADTDPFFSDIKGHWAEKSIAKVVEQNLMQGIGRNEQGDNLFAPDSLVTRSQAAAVLVRAFNLDYGYSHSLKEAMVVDYYRDVDNDSWYAEPVLLCTLNKIFSVEGDRFYPDHPITRIEMAQAIQRSFIAKNINVPMIQILPYFNDTQDLNNEELNAVVFVHNTSIMKGNDEYFRPSDRVTRAEMARIISACKEIIELNMANDQSDVAISIQKISVQEQRPHMEIDFEIPLVTGMADQDHQTKINKRWEQDAENFKQEVAYTLDDYVKNAEIAGYPVHTYQAFSRIQEGYASSKFLSLYIDYYSYTGGAHGYTERRPYNIDLSTGQDVALNDLFTPGYDYCSIINDFINKQIDTNPENFFEGEMGFMGIDEQQPFYIKDGHIVIYFDLYEIAPYAAGIQEFRLPLDSFEGNLRIPA
jgi:hypothetical protein